MVPPAMDVPWNHDEMGYPKDVQDQQKLFDREEYVTIVQEKEREKGLTEGCNLSSALQDSERQYLVSAMRLYQRGKPKWYLKVMDRFSNNLRTRR